MVQTVKILKTKFLEMYANRELEDPIGPVQTGTVARLYARSTIGQANNPEGYIVVYCEV